LDYDQSLISSLSEKKRQKIKNKNPEEQLDVEDPTLLDFIVYIIKFGRSITSKSPTF
jgi:hypothetical protein